MWPQLRETRLKSRGYNFSVRAVRDLFEPPACAMLQRGKQARRYNFQITSATGWPAGINGFSFMSPTMVTCAIPGLGYAIASS